MRRDESIMNEFGISESAVDATRRVLQTHRSPESLDRPTFAIPGGEFRARRDSIETYYSILDLIEVDLPTKQTTDALLDVYFYTVHWFSLVVYEPTFRQRYESIIAMGVARSADRPFLLLLLMILVMGCHYGRSAASERLQQVDLDDLRSRYLKVVRQNFMDLLDEDSVEFVQICTLLGSYWLYWGKPRSSFTILGAAIKAAQAISLHRQPSGRLPQQVIEERKRVWWTIYTWDRFATVVYGRPFSISDRDCDVAMPTRYTEHLTDIHRIEEADIELSPYQSNLNRVYQIASPLLENIYSIRYSLGFSPFEMAETVRQIDLAMRAWQRELPPDLNLDDYQDFTPQPSLQKRMHQLQALSLRLTMLNLTIVIHRPLLADWRQRRRWRPQGNGNDADNDAEQRVYDTSFDQCLKAAIAISRLGQEKPNLIALAGKTHLLSFLAMNIFTASVVLFICGLSDILSNAAQEAKRGMSRNLKMLKSISHPGSLSSQCSVIVEDLIQMILEKEKDEMLLGPIQVEENNTADPSHNRHDHHIAMPSESATRASSAQLLDAVGGHPATFGRTMEQLHRVLKDAAHPEPSLPPPTMWDANFVAGDVSAQDMNQFWLWDFDPTTNDSITDWSSVGYDGV